MALTLEQVPEGTRVRILEQGDDKQLARKLLSLGLRIGAEVEVLQHRGQGVVVVSSGTRVALGSGVASSLLVENI
jgi:ferrous iron transport protein A